MHRREFLGVSTAGFVAAALLPNGLLRGNDAIAAVLDEPPSFTSVEEIYRRQWRWDRIVKASHGRSNCLSACSWDIYVRDGVVWREEQNRVYSAQEEGVPDFNPRGCQKGACYSEQTYSPMRVLHPMKRVGPRGSGRWERISWDEAYTTIADKIIDTLAENKPQRVVYDYGTSNMDFGPDQAWETRLFSLLGCTEVDSYGLLGDQMMGTIQTFGTQSVEGSSDDWFHSDYIVIWMGNPVTTRIPDAHFLTEARYNGAQLVCISPDYSPTATKADLWMPIEPRTDAALAMAAAHVIINEKLYKEDYLRQYTDLSFLIREDNGRFLRARDLDASADGEHRYYGWDRKRSAPFEMPGCGDHDAGTTKLPDDVDIALDGRFEVKLADGSTVKVRTNWNLLAERVQKWSPEAVSEETKLNPALIRQFARGFAGAKAPMIFASYGAAKGYHSDLEQRLQALLCALVGSHGKPGGGIRTVSFNLPEAFPIIAYGQAENFGDEYAPIRSAMEALESADLNGNAGVLRLLFNLNGEDSVQQEHILQTMRSGAVPGIPFFYELEPEWKKVMEDAHDKSYPRSLADYMGDALNSEGYAKNPHMKQAEIPDLYIFTGSNPLRRLWRHDAIEKSLWDKIGLVVGITPQLNYTSLHSDILLPAAGWYEKLGLKYTPSYIPYLIINDKAIEPQGQSKCEYIMMGELAQKISERAVAKGKLQYTDLFGRTLRLDNTYERWSYNGRFPATEEGKEEAFRFMLKISGMSNPYFLCTMREHGIVRALEELFEDDITLDQLRRDGAVEIHSTGKYSPMNAMGTAKHKGKTITPHQRFIHEHKRYPTATGRMQFYIDHPWFIEADEASPTYKPTPSLTGTPQPFFLSGGHTRWSIHSQWRENPTMLRLQRGEPALWVSVEDAQELGISDGELIEMYNDLGSCQCKAKVAAAMRPGTVLMYHAWQPWQFRNGVSDKTLYGSPIKPLHIAGNYPQLNFRLAGAQPCHSPRDTRIGLRRIES
ncbi:MAG: molybdopterin-dependent oxidoreductase [Gammaproteobacteria bacterium]